MKGTRVLGAVCASILATSLGTLAACGGAPESKEPTTAQAVSAASVSIALFDENGTRVGDGSGVMIAPHLVLTSGHLISGKHKWVVTSADGKQKATGSRGLTYDWMKYDSNKAHPRKHDIGVIYLDERIKLPAYPKLVAERSVDGTKATRIHGSGAAFQQIDMTLAKYKSSPNAWLGDGLAGERLDTGAAVYDARGILGVVSGRGMTTGKLYVARVDGLVKWLAPKIACAGGATGVRTYAPPSIDKSEEICEDAGAGTSSGNPGGDGTTSGGPGGGGPGDDNGGTCDGDDDGVCSGNCGAGGNDGSGGTNGANPGGDGSNGSTNPGGDGTPSSSGAPGDDTGSSSGDNGSNPGGDGTPSSSGSPGSDGSSNPGGDGTPGSSGAPGSTGSSGGNTNESSGPSGSTSGAPGGGAGGSQGTVPGSDNGGDSGEACQGPSDNPDVCPPEPDGCVGPSCGGGQPDDSIDYGNCACGSSGGESIYLR